MIFLQPVVGRGLQERADFAAGVHEVVASPFADADILARVLIKIGAVEPFQPVKVGGKVNRHVVQDDADAVLMQIVHQVHELLRSAVTAGRCKEAGVLVPPADVRRVLGQRHEFHIVVAALLQVLRQRRRQFLVVVPVGVFGLLLRFGFGPPGANVQFVDVQRLVETVGPGPHPLAVVELVAVQVPDDRVVVRAQFHAEPERIRFIVRGVVFVVDDVFVAVPFAGAFHVTLPEVAARRRTHGNLVSSVQNDGTVCLGCIDPEYGTVLHDVGAEVFISVKTVSFVEGIGIHKSSYSCLFFVYY